MKVHLQQLKPHVKRDLRRQEYLLRKYNGGFLPCQYMGDLQKNCWTQGASTFYSRMTPNEYSSRICPMPGISAISSVLSLTLQIFLSITVLIVANGI